MALNNNHVHKIAPIQIIKLYAEEGITISIDQATEILKFMRLLVEMALDKVEGYPCKKEMGSNPDGLPNY